MWAEAEAGMWREREELGLGRSLLSRGLGYITGSTRVQASPPRLPPSSRGQSSGLPSDPPGFAS